MEKLLLRINRKAPSNKLDVGKRTLHYALNDAQIHIVIVHRYESNKEIIIHIG